MSEIKTQYFRDKQFQVQKGSTHPEYSFATFDTEEKSFREQYWNIKENDVVFDIGASYGAYTLAACSMGAFVFSFEPEPSVYPDLVANINLNKFDKCFHKNIGLWSATTTVDMKQYAPHWAPQTITSDYIVTTIDEIMNNNNIQKLDWIKIDVEGAEENVIHGGLMSINKFVPNMIIECHTFLNSDITKNIKTILTRLNKYNFEEIGRDPCIMLICTPKG